MAHCPVHFIVHLLRKSTRKAVAGLFVCLFSFSKKVFCSAGTEVVKYVD